MIDNTIRTPKYILQRAHVCEHFSRVLTLSHDASPFHEEKMSFVSHTNIFRPLLVPWMHLVKFLGMLQRQISQPTVLI
jgi:hypothetical protein